MPDLFDVCRSTSLTTSDHEAFARLSSAITDKAPGDVEVFQVSNAVVGVLNSNNAESISHARNESTTMSVLVGAIAENPYTRESQELASDLQSGTSPFMSEVVAPSAGFAASATGATSWLISDDFGHYPIYYHATSDHLFFSTKFSTLLCASLFPWDIDGRAVIDFFTFEHLTGNRTFAENVHLLPAGAVLTFDSNGIAIRVRTESFCYRPDFSLTPARVAEIMAEDVKRSVEFNTRGADSIALPLSGGLDSRALLAALLPLGKTLTAHTFGSSQNNSDVRYAKALSQQAGIPHRTVTVDGSYLHRWLDYGIHVTGGMMSCNHYHIVNLIDSLRADSSMTLDGLGGGALSGAYVNVRAVSATSPQSAIESLFRKRATGLGSAAMRSEFFTAEFLASHNYDPISSVKTHFEGLGSDPTWLGYQRFLVGERQRRFIQLGPHLLRPYLTVRAPFYSTALQEFVQQIPLRYLLGQKAYVRMHAEHFRELANVPDTKCELPLSYPHSIRAANRFLKRSSHYVRRKILRSVTANSKSMPTDYAGWYKNELRELVSDELTQGVSPVADIVRPEAVAKLVHDHVTGVSNYSTLIGCALTFLRWKKSVRPDS